MGKHILVTSTDMMMVQFLIPHLKKLKERGYEIEVACSNVGGRLDEVREKLCTTADAVHMVRLVRAPFKVSNLKGYLDLKRIIDKKHFDIIWTNEPVMGVMTRLAAQKARRRQTKVLYMVHGFHFYDGAPVRNWFLYYPIEWYVARYCDEIVTINREDYERAKNMKAASVRYIHGIGVDTERYQNTEIKGSVREELGLKEDSFIVLSVGELLPRKNHRVMLYALEQLKDRNVHYLICGKGQLEHDLRVLAEQLGIADQVHFLGYRADVIRICRQADVFALPSLREGLGLAGLEAMFCGLPILSSDTSGPRDYMKNGKTGFMYHPDDAKGFADGIRTLKKYPELRTTFGDYNRQAVTPFCIDYVKQEILELFEELI